MPAERLAPTVLAWRNAIGNRAHAVVKERRVDEPRPDVERVDEIAGKPAKTPGLVGVHDEIVLAMQETVIKIDDALHEFRRKNPDAAVVEQVYASGSAVTLKDRIVAEVWVAVNDTEPAERKPPSGEHGSRPRGARGKRIVLVGQHAAAFEPVEGEQPAGRKRRPCVRHAYATDAFEHHAIERHVLGFAAVIELFTHARADLLSDLGGIDCGVEPPADGEQPLQLLQIGLDRRLHIGILQLAGKQRSVKRAGAMHLPQGRRRRSAVLEYCT